MNRTNNPNLGNVGGWKGFATLTVDVEDWYHILDSPATPNLQQWSSLPQRFDKNLMLLLELLQKSSAKATFFWLGWLAERHKDLVRKCQDAGHEIASHGYAHVLAYRVGRKAFHDDITQAREILEDITGQQVRGCRAAGFSITDTTPWAFEVIKEAGYEYDSSVYPGSRGHGGLADSPLVPYFVHTPSGHLLEIPTSAIEVLGHRTNVFGGGYLRLATKQIIKWGIRQLRTTGRPLIIYVHPREVDPKHPRLALSLRRRFKCYVGLKSTLPKLKWLCREHSFGTALDMIESYVKSFYLEGKAIPVVNLDTKFAHESSHPAQEQAEALSNELLRKRLLVVEEAMANFLRPRLLIGNKLEKALQPQIVGIPRRRVSPEPKVRLDLDEEHPK